MNPARELALEIERLLHCAPEPEVHRATMSSLACKSLAATIAGLIAEHEPMLKAECDGATVTVREVGGSMAMRFTVEAEQTPLRNRELKKETNHE
jgi:hypothetical protein